VEVKENQMDEAKRFLRYVIPGLVFIVDTILFLLVLNFAQTTASHLTNFLAQHGNQQEGKTGLMPQVAIGLSAAWKVQAWSEDL
jgi:hypothetical protein